MVGDGNGNVFIYKNTNNNTNPILDSGTFVLYNNDDRATPIFEDWNGDGYMDLIVGNLTGTIQVYENQGTDANPSFSSYTNLQVGGTDFDLTTGSDRSAPRIYDWNRDGLKDILVGDVTGYIYYLQNVGTNDAPVFNTAQQMLLRDGSPLRYISDPFSTGPRSRLDITDWNNDGYADIVVGGTDGRLMLFLAQCTDNDGDGYALKGDGCVVIDCDDSDAYINPGAYDLPGNEIDENCDGFLSCDPNTYWRNHGQFMNCVAQETNVLIEQGILTQEEGDLLISSAAQTDVGKK